VRAFGWLTERPVAHRGYHDPAAGRVENTLAAAEEAATRGFAVECDIRLTADDHVIVFHDHHLDRLTTGSGAVHMRSHAELTALELRGSGHRVPTLAELLAVVAGRVPLFVELKTGEGGDRRLAEQAAPLLNDYVGPVAVMSFEPRTVRAMSALTPHLPRGIVADDFAAEKWPSLSARRFALRHLLAAPWVRPDFMAYCVQDLPASAPLLLRHFGLPLLTWTVRSEEDRRTARRYADQIIFEGFDPAADTNRTISP
jgi:glycerophosphoryl diester phosphodiesterase